MADPQAPIDTTVIPKTPAIPATSNLKGAKVEGKDISTPPVRYAVLFDQRSTPSVLLTTVDWNDVVNRNNQLKAEAGKNWTLTSFHTQEDNARFTNFTAVWNQIPGESFIGRWSDWSNFTTHFDAEKGKKRLIDFHVGPSGGARWFTGLWGDAPLEQTFVRDLTLEAFNAKLKELTASAWRLVKIQLYPDSAHRTFNIAGLFQKDGDARQHDLVVTSEWNEFNRVYKAHENALKPELRLRLVDLQVYDDYDKATRWYVGVYRQGNITGFGEFGLTFDTLKTKQEAANAGLPNQQLIKAIRYTDQLYLFNPSWIKSLEQILKPKVNGYAAKVFFGNITVGAQYGAARVQVDSPNKPPLPFTMKTRLNLASVSKPITAVVILKILEDKKISVDAPFYAQANVQKQFPSVGPGVDKVTIRNLLQHRSGMSVNNQLMFGETPGTSGSIFTFLGKYLKEQNVTENRRGILQAYSNTNYTIIQALISCITTVTDPKDPAFTNNGQVNDHYWQYVAQNFLRPWGIDTSSFNPIPDARDTAALSYGKLPSVHPGLYWEQGDGVAAGSWIASANDLSSFLTFTRNGQYVNDIGGMLGNNLGWWKYEGIYGQYFFHNGGIGSTATATGEKYGLSTSMIIFPGRIGAVILANGENVGAFEALVEAFEVNVPKLAG